MTTDLPPIPPTVSELAEQSGYKEVDFKIHWNGYDVYYVKSMLPKDGFWGAPVLILYKNQHAHFANEQEYFEATKAFHQSKQK